MMVKELIEILLKLDQEQEVYIIDNETGQSYDPRETISYDDKEHGYIL